MEGNDPANVWVENSCPECGGDVVYPRAPLGTKSGFCVECGSKVPPTGTKPQVREPN